MARIGTEIKLFFKFSMVFYALGIQKRGCFPVSAVKEAAEVANLSMKAL